MSEAYPVPADEPERRAEVHRYEPEPLRDPVLDEVARVAGALCDAEWAGVSLVREDELVFPAIEGLDLETLAREHAPCAHSICSPASVMVVEDATQDPRTADNPCVTGEPGVRFYAGAPLETPGGHALGTVFAMKGEPADLSTDQREGLEALSRLAVHRLVDEGAGPPRGANLGAFAAAVGDELRTVLVQLAGNLSILDHAVRKDPGGKVADLLDEMEQGTRRFDELTEDLLRFAKVGDQGLEFEPVGLDLLVDDLVDELASELSVAGGRVEAPPLPAVRGDEALVRVLLESLVRNAVRYSGEDPPRILVTAEPDREGWVRVEVSDDGIGIPEDEQDEVFELFHRASNAGARAGTGVGLALAKRIVEAHGGEIGLDAAPGEGTTVWFTLPAAGDRAEDA